MAIYNNEYEYIRYSCRPLFVGYALIIEMNQAEAAAKFGQC
jgi:hypothetical protein